MQMAWLTAGAHVHLEIEAHVAASISRRCFKPRRCGSRSGRCNAVDEERGGAARAVTEISASLPSN